MSSGQSTATKRKKKKQAASSSSSTTTAHRSSSEEEETTHRSSMEEESSEETGGTVASHLNAAKWFANESLLNHANVVGTINLVKQPKPLQTGTANPVQHARMRVGMAKRQSIFIKEHSTSAQSQIAVASSRLANALRMPIIAKVHFYSAGGVEGAAAKRAPGLSTFHYVQAPGGPKRRIYLAFDFKNPMIQQGLADLQLFDCITGQKDRHGGNICIDPKTGEVTGIDDDLAFEKGAPVKLFDEDFDAYVGFPLLVRASTRLKVLALNPEKLRDILVRKGDPKELSDQSIAIAQQRLGLVQDRLKKMPSGQILDDEDWGDDTYNRLMAEPSHPKFGVRPIAARSYLKTLATELITVLAGHGDQVFNGPVEVAYPPEGGAAVLPPKTSGPVGTAPTPPTSAPSTSTSTTSTLAQSSGAPAAWRRVATSGVTSPRSPGSSSTSAHLVSPRPHVGVARNSPRPGPGGLGSVNTGSKTGGGIGGFLDVQDDEEIGNPGEFDDSQSSEDPQTDDVPPSTSLLASRRPGAVSPRGPAPTTPANSTLSPTATTTATSNTSTSYPRAWDTGTSTRRWNPGPLSASTSSTSTGTAAKRNPTTSLLSSSRIGVPSSGTSPVSPSPLSPPALSPLPSVSTSSTASPSTASPSPNAASARSRLGVGPPPLPMPPHTPQALPPALQTPPLPPLPRLPLSASRSPGRVAPHLSPLSRVTGPPSLTPTSQPSPAPPGTGTSASIPSVHTQLPQLPSPPLTSGQPLRSSGTQTERLPTDSDDEP